MEVVILTFQSYRWFNNSNDHEGG